MNLEVKLNMTIILMEIFEVYKILSCFILVGDKILHVYCRIVGRVSLH